MIASRSFRTFTGVVLAFSCLGLPQLASVANAQAANAQAANAAPSDWSVVVGGGGGFGPKYEGGKKTSFGVMPFVDITWKDRLFLNQNGLGVYAFSSKDLKAGVALGYGGGRSEKDGDLLRGMGKIKSSAKANAFMGYTVDLFTFSAALSRDLGGANGTTATFGGELEIPVAERFSLSAGLSTTWASKNHMREYFGVDAAQAARSGNRQFSASAGFKNVEFSLGAKYAFAPNWMLISALNVTSLTGDAAKSPISEKDTAVSGMLGVAYKF